MNNNKIQGLTSDQMAATLAFVTKISEDSLPKDIPKTTPLSQETEEGSTLEQPQTPENEPGEEMPQEAVEEPQEPKTEEYEAKLDVLSQDMMSVKEMLQQLLNKDEKLPE